MVAWGPDAEWFTLDLSTGALSRHSAPDHESPSDANADNAHIVRPTARDADGNVVRVVRLVVGVSDIDVPGSVPVSPTAPVPGSQMGVVISDPDRVGRVRQVERQSRTRFGSGRVSAGSNRLLTAQEAGPRHRARDVP